MSKLGVDLIYICVILSLSKEKRSYLWKKKEIKIDQICLSHEELNSLNATIDVLDELYDSMTKHINYAKQDIVKEFDFYHLNDETILKVVNVLAYICEVHGILTEQI